MSWLHALPRLIRLPNCFTAVPDSWAGWFVGLALLDTVAAAWDWSALARLAATSFMAYAGGVALNDVVDVAHDRHHRPERPIPSGAVPWATACALSLAALAIAAIVATTLGPAATLGATVLVALIVAYNLIHKKRPAVGLPLMALTRAANATVGLLAAADASGVACLTIPLAASSLPIVLALWVLSISIVARLETRFLLAKRLVPRMIVLIAGLDAAVVLVLTGDPFFAGAVAAWAVPAHVLSRHVAMS